MRSLTKETVQVIQFNIRQILLFELIYRLLTFPIYSQFVNQGVRFALRAAGYSYLTAGNVGFFLLRPWTILCLLVLGVTGLLLLMVEIGGLITVFQGAAYYRRLEFWEILSGGLSKAFDELRRRNGKLLLLALVDFVLTNLFLIYRMFTHVRPLSFVLMETLKNPAGRLGILLVYVFCILVAMPGIYTFHVCMIEQKSFRDAYRRSRGLLKGHGVKTCALLALYNGLAAASLVAVYAVCVLLAAVFVAVFTDKNLALAVLLLTCDKIELILIFIGGIVFSVVNMAAVTVQYYQYGRQLIHEESWDFETPAKTLKNRRVALTVMAVILAVSVFYIFDIVRNGYSLTKNVQAEIQITAHRGSSRTAPENTMAAIRAAVEELADYAEIDVQETSDGVVVLGHDSSLKRVAGVNRPISSYTFDELETLDAGSWFSKEYAGERIPSLEEVMQFAKGRLDLNIEIKYLGKGSGLPQKVTALIEEHDMVDQCVVTSTSLSYLRQVKELNPDIRTGYIVSAAYGDYYSSIYIDFVSLRSSFVSERLVENAHEEGKAVHAWTVNTKSGMEQMKLMGVDNIITDYPVLAREIAYREEATENLLETIRLVFH